MNDVMKAGAMLCLAALAACSSAPPAPVAPPDWVSGAAARYPAASYLLGRGAAGDLNDAGDRARADLAKGLEVEVQVETTDVQTYALDQPVARTPGAPEESLRLDVTRSVATRTDQILRGVQIAETWRDPATATHHALAVLPRSAALQSLQSDIRALDDATAAEIARARGAGGDPFTAIAAADRAVRNQTERAALQRMLQVVDLSGHGLPERWTVTQLRNDRNGLIARIRIRPQAAGDETGKVGPALAGALGEAGFTVVAEGAADYTLAAVLELADLGRKDDWYWFTGTLEIVLGDAAGQVRGSHRWDLKSSGQDAQLAYRRAMDQVEATLDQELLPTLLSFAATH